MPLSLLVTLTLIVLVVIFYYTFDLINLFIWKTPTISSNKVILQKLKSTKVSKLLSGKKNLVELGSSYGFVLFWLSKHYQLTGVGYETNLGPYLRSFIYKFLFYRFSSSKVVWKSFFKADFTKAEVVYCFLVPSLMVRVAQEVVPQLAKGTIILSNSFMVPGLEPVLVLEGSKYRLQTLYVYQI